MLRSMFHKLNRTLPISANSGCYSLFACTLAILVFGGLTAQAAVPVVSGPTDYSFSHCETGTLDFVASDQENNFPYDWEIVSGPGTLAVTGAHSARWTCDDAPQSGTAVLEIRACDISGTWGPVHTVNLEFLNTAPEIVSVEDISPWEAMPIGVGQTKTRTIVALDFDECDSLSWSIVSWFPQSSGDLVTIEDGVVTYKPADGEASVEMVVEVSDGLESTQITIHWRVRWCVCKWLQIDRVDGAMPGQFADVVVRINDLDSWYGLGSFDLLFAYDAGIMTFNEALRGDIYEDCNWEYLSYQVGMNEDGCATCPTGLVRVVGVVGASGPQEPPYCMLENDRTTLTVLRFQLADDERVSCQFAPVRFYWADCESNLLTIADGTESQISTNVVDYDPYQGFVDITDDLSSLPSYAGTPDECLTGEPGEPYRICTFINGGIEVLCPNGDPEPGDINQNGIRYEMSDAVLFQRFLTEIIPCPDPPAQGGYATDINRDGQILTVADYVLLLRIITGDVLPGSYKTSPAPAAYTHKNGTLGVDTKMGAALVTLRGDAPVRSLAEGMDMAQGVVEGNRRILLYSLDGKATFSGAFLETDAEILSIEFATWDGQTVMLKNQPQTFTLKQNYPNPFNPVTTICFALPEASDVSLDVINAIGQTVAHLVAERLDKGPHMVKWDAINMPSGVYFYRLKANGIFETKKMVLLK